MSDETKHAGTGHYCGECMHLCEPQDNEDSHGCNPTADVRDEFDARADGGKWKTTLPGASACKHFHLSVAAQQVEQQRRIANRIAGLKSSLDALSGLNVRVC